MKSYRKSKGKGNERWIYRGRLRKIRMRRERRNKGGNIYQEKEDKECKEKVKEE